MIFHGDKLVTDYFDIIPVAGFFTKATFLSVEVNFKKIKGPMLGRAQRDALDLFMKTS